LCGEVKGDIIYIYVRDEDRAFKVLKHEFLDYILSREVVKPLVDYMNLQKNLIERLIYQRKEDFVERILKII